MLHLDQLYAQRLSENINQKLNDGFNHLIKKNLILGQFLAFFTIFTKCVLHTVAILANTFEYAVRGFFSLFSSKGSAREYFSTLSSFLVINTVNAATILPDIFIRTYYVLKESEIHHFQTKHTLFYKIMNLI